MDKPTPSQRYLQDLQQPGFSEDPAQARAVEELNAIHAQLLEQVPTRNQLAKGHWPPVRGLYMHGGVGRGKTYLMDCFYDALPFSRRKRTHFHRFMQSVHEARNEYQNQRDPLRKIASDLSREARVLCFDEFFVSDIADAMILGRLLGYLFRRGVTLITTSNVAPEDLYAGGLQRERFLPAIAQIQEHTRSLSVDGGVDYRLRVLKQAEIYHHPLDEQADRNLSHYFDAIAPEPGRDNVSLNVLGRDIACRRLGQGVVWFDFEEICGTNRAATDYVEIARGFHTVLLSGLPVLGADREDAARRLLHLIDEFYDRGVKLIISAQAAAAEIYVGERLQFEFERAVSRLLEMASEDYLARPHLA